MKASCQDWCLYSFQPVKVVAQIKMNKDEDESRLLKEGLQMAMVLSVSLTKSTLLLSVSLKGTLLPALKVGTARKSRRVVSSSMGWCDEDKIIMCVSGVHFVYRFIQRIKKNTYSVACRFNILKTAFQSSSLVEPITNQHQWLISPTSCFNSTGETLKNSCSLSLEGKETFWRLVVLKVFIFFLYFAISLHEPCRFRPLTLYCQSLKIGEHKLTMCIISQCSQCC